MTLLCMKHCGTLNKAYIFLSVSIDYIHMYMYIYISPCMLLNVTLVKGLLHGE